MLATVLCLGLAAPPPPQAGAVADDALLRRAAAEFRTGSSAAAQTSLRQAAADFEELVRRGIRNALLYRNLGNAYALAGDDVRALFAYDRGLQLRPADPDLLASRAFIRRRLGLPPDDPGWAPAWAETRLARGARFALPAALAAYCVAWLTLAVWATARTPSLLAVALAAFGLAAVLLISALLATGTLRDTDRSHLVVMADAGVVLRKGNGPSYPACTGAPLRPGEEGRLLFRRDDWLQVEFPSGRIGWIPRAAALMEDP